VGIRGRPRPSGVRPGWYPSASRRIGRGSGDYADVIVSPAELVVVHSNSVKATAEQWAVVQSVQKALPGATVT